jgi:hypothetical protein
VGAYKILGGDMQVGDLVMHIRDDKTLGIVTAIHIFPHDSHWADVLWNDMDRTFKERMRNLKVVSCK